MLHVYQAQTQNVRALTSSIRQVRRALNRSLVMGDQTQVVTFTKLYALLFCAWAEANFMKVLHTPYGFTPAEVQQVLDAKSYGIAEAWKKSVALGLRHIDATRGSFRPNARLRLDLAIDNHVLDPTLLRNKLAHGQWVIALNRSNTNINSDLTQRIAALDLVTIDGWLKAQQLLASVIETMIESPKKAFVRDWFCFVVELEEQLIDIEKRTLEDHLKVLRRKTRRTNVVGISDATP